MFLQEDRPMLCSQSDQELSHKEQVQLEHRRKRNNCVEIGTFTLVHS